MRYWIDTLDGDHDLEGVLEVEAESFTNPWTRDMYAWELQNRSVCHIFVVRTPEQRVAGFCAFWLVVDEIHINNVAMRPALRGQGIGTQLMKRVFEEAKRLGARRATLEGLAARDDAWLERTLRAAPALNAHWAWFHVAEDEINHRGQIRWLRARLGMATTGLARS